MSEETRDNKRTAAAPPAPENARQRWMKYGANVLLTCVLVVAVAAVVVWAAQRYRARPDLTAGASNSLKPQTVNIIKDLNQPVRLVSLYPKLKQEGKAAEEDMHQPVVDLLEAYQRNGKNISVQAIDPVAEPEELYKWIGEVTAKYGGNAGAYRQALEAFPATIEGIKKLAAAEAEKITKFPEDLELKDQRQADTLNLAYITVKAFPTLLGQIDAAVKKELEERIPNYKGAVDAVREMLGPFSRQAEQLGTALGELQKDETAPKALRDYAAGSVPQFAAMKKQADDLLAKTENLGELKLDEVRRQLLAPEGEAPPPAIAVMGENDIRMVDIGDVWKSGESTGFRQPGSDAGPPKLRFAGEQRLTTAILALTQAEKPKVAFVRAGGPPVAGNFMGQGGQFSQIADRLRAYNFDVVEADITGEWAQQAMRQQMPAPPEPSAEELAKAVWVVVSQSNMTQFGPMPAGPELGQRLKAHLDAGGSAMVLFDVQIVPSGPGGALSLAGGDDLSVALKDWGVARASNVMAVHEPVETASAEAGGDFVEAARRQPHIFVLNEFGDHAITTPMRSLDLAFVPVVPVASPGAAGVKVTPIIPLPQDPQSWGESDVSFLSRNASGPPTLDESTGDVAGPVYAGAAAEREGKGRLVVIGCSNFAADGLLNFPDPKIRKMNVARFPANGELFTNSVFWLSNQEKMIALSPSALDVTRIEPIKPGVLAFWRVGVLLIGLPLLALATGLFVWHTRRD